MGEGRLKELIKKTFGVEPKTQHPLPAPNNKWRFDFFLRDQNKIIEYDGGQHFASVPVFGGDAAFARQRSRDLQKVKACFSNGIRMIRIHYHWIFQKEESKIAFLRAAVASKEPLVVTRADMYSWLKDAGHNPVQTRFKPDKSKR